MCLWAGLQIVLCNHSWSSELSGLCFLTRWCHWLDFMCRWSCMLWSEVGQGHRLGFAIAEAVGLALLLGEVTGQALWSAGLPAIPRSWEGLKTVVLVGLGCYLGSLVRWGCRLCSTIGCDHSLGSLPGPGHRLCSAIRQGLRLRSAAGWSGRLASMMAGLYAGL